MEEQKKNPKLRFERFTDHWKDKKLNVIADIIGGGTPSTSVSEYWNGDIDWYSPTEIGNEVYAKGSVNKITVEGYENSSAKMLPPNKTILFTSRAGIGDMAILQKEGCTNQGFQSLVLNNGYDPYFIYSAGHLIKKYALSKASGSTFLEISGKILGKMELAVPESENEQQQIGSFFKNIDELITKHQKKQSRLVTLKKSMLEKMFPKEGQSVPEIRFKGFGGDWVESELENLGDFFKGKGLSKNVVSSKGKYKCLLYGHLFTEYGMIITRVNFSTNAEFEPQVVSKAGDVFIPCSSTTPTGIEKATSIEYDGVIIGGDINVIRPNETILGSFLSINLNANGHKIIPLIKGITVRHLDIPDLKTVQVNFPESINEQEKIITYFKKMDILINNHQKQLKKLKNFKQSLSEKMFV
jgi:type I restriction enzyme, S subunit